MKPRHLSGSERKMIGLTITSLGREGEGLAFFEGKRIYVPDALPGESVTATLTDQLDRDVFRAALESIDHSGEMRGSPPCPHYGCCGGCSLQHIKEESYRDWKTAQIKSLLAKSGFKPECWDDPVFIPQATRRRATFAVLKKGREIFCGFQERRSHRISKINSCLLLHPRLLELLEGSKPFLSELLRDGRQADLFLQVVDGQAEGVLTGMAPPTRMMSETMIAWANALNLHRLGWRGKQRDEPETLIQRCPVRARFGPLTVDLPPGAFLQPSREGEQALSEAVRSMLGEAQGPFLDLFAGCGTFTGVLAERGAVHSVELDPAAVSALDKAKGHLKLTVERRNLFTAPVETKKLNAFGAAVLDPPRAGAAEQSEALSRSRIPTVVYVSCNPATFAKDALILEKGGYRLHKVKVVDQFIWSAHTELAGLFRKQ